MFQSEKDYWFGTYRSYNHKSTVTITEDAVIEEDGETHPYKVYGYYKDEGTGCYLLRIRYTEIEDCYPEDGYTLLCMFHQKLRFYTSIDVLHQMNDGTMANAPVLRNYRLTAEPETELFVKNKI